MIDWHSHFHRGSPAFTEDDINTLFLNKSYHELDKVVIVAENADDCDIVVDQAIRYPGFYHACVGVHPVQPIETDQIRSCSQQDLFAFTDWFSKRLEAVGSSLQAMGVVGIGECGLDFSPRIFSSCKTEHDKDQVKELQKQIFKKQIQLALSHDLMVNVHSRNSGHHAIEVLKQCQADRVLMHAFDGRTHYAVEASEKYGYFFSIPPSIARSETMAKWAQRIPVDRVLLGSDSPALASIQGQINRPQNIKISKQWLIENRNLTSSEIDVILDANARCLFRFDN